MGDKQRICGVPVLKSHWLPLLSRWFFKNMTSEPHFDKPNRMSILFWDLLLSFFLCLHCVLWFLFMESSLLQRFINYLHFWGISGKYPTCLLSIGRQPYSIRAGRSCHYPETRGSQFQPFIQSTIDKLFVCFFLILMLTLSLKQKKLEFPRVKYF